MVTLDQNEVSSEKDEPLFLFRGHDLLDLMTYWWQLARVFDAMQRISNREPDEDPMENQEAMSKLRQEMADHIMSLELRNDGTTDFEQAPLIFGDAMLKARAVTGEDDRG